MSAKTVFISYSHDSDEHRKRVLALSERLRADGIETLLDQYVNGSPSQGWPRWMLDQLDAANAVLVVCTETYYRRFRGHEEPGKGKGVDWEGALITQEIYDRRSQTLKFVPVFLSAAAEDWIPEPLRSTTHYALTSEFGYQGLYDFLLEQAGVQPGPVGTLKPKPREKGVALTFDEPPASEVKIDISRIIKYAPAELIGREAETKLLYLLLAANALQIAVPAEHSYAVNHLPHFCRVVIKKTNLILGPKGWYLVATSVRAWKQTPNLVQARRADTWFLETLFRTFGAHGPGSP
jgi:hypothetical protein